MSTKQIASSTLWQVASQATMAALSIVTVKFVAIGLSLELAGQYNTAYGYLQIFGILADFGLYAVAVREVSRAKDKEHMLGALIVLRAIILAMSLGAALLIAWVIPQWKGSPLPVGITIAAFVPFFTLLAGMLRTIFQVHYKMQHVFAAEVTQRVITVTLTGVFIVMGTRESTDVNVLYSFLAIGGIGAFALLLLSLVSARRFMKLKLTWDPAVLRHALKLAAPYGIAFLCTALYRQSDVTLIGLLRNDHELQNAYYGFVQRAMDMAYLFPTFLMNSALPLLSERHGKGEDTRDFLGTVFTAVLLLGITAALFAAFWARPLMQLLTTDAYLSRGGYPGSDTALGLLSVSMLCNGMLVFCFYALLTRHAWRPLVGSLSVGVVVSLTLNLLLIPNLGFVGASLTSVIVHLLLTLLLLPLSYRALPFRLSITHGKQILLYTVGLAAFLFAARPFLINSYATAIGLAAGGIWILAIAWGAGIHRTLKI